MKFFKFAVVSILCFFLSSSAFAIDGYLFLSIQKMSAIIEDKCPPSKCVVVAIGRSPTPIAAFLETKYPEGYVYNLPLTKFRYGTSDLPRLSPLQEQKLFKHFDIYFPNEAQLKGRNILFVDYSATGESLVSAYIYAGKYIVERQATHFSHSVPKVEMLAFTDTTAEETGLHPWIRLRIVMDERAVFHKIDSSGGEIDYPEASLTNQRFAHGSFEDLSAYGAFNLMRDPVDLVKKEPSSAYKQFMAEILAYRTIPEMVSTDPYSFLNDLFQLTVVQEGEFDAEVWLNPTNKTEFDRLAEQIQWGSTLEQEFYYEKVAEHLASSNGSAVSQVAIHRLTRYRGSSPSRADLFRLALANPENRIDSTAIELFYMLGQTVGRNPRENSFVLDMMSVVLNNYPHLLEALGEILPFGDSELSPAENMYQFYQPVFESRNEGLVAKAIVQIKKYPERYSTSPTFIGARITPPFRSVLIDKIREKHNVVIED